MFGRAFLLSTFIVAVIFVSTLNATSKCTLNGKEVPCHTLQELSSRQKRSVIPDWTPEVNCTQTCDENGGNCAMNCYDITTPAAPRVSGATASPAALEATTTTTSDSIKNGYGICLIVASIFAYIFLH